MKRSLHSAGRKYGVALAVLGLFGAANVQAAEPFPNGGTLEANVEYEIVSTSTAHSATYIPTADGKMTYNCGNVFKAYSDEAHTSLLNGTYEGYVNGSTGYSLNVVKDVPVYFYADDWGMWSAYPGMIFQITQDAPIEIVYMSNEPGSTLSVTSGLKDIVIAFNQPVHASKAVLSVDGTDASAEIEMSPVDATNMSIEFLSAMYQLMDSGDIKGGEEISIAVSGIVNEAGEEYDDGNDLVLHYIAPIPPVRLVNVVLPDPFCAFWSAGDAAAVLIATFSGDISRANYELMYGNFEPESTDKYVESGSSDNPDSYAKVSIDKNIVTIDFAGYQRTPADMLTSGTLYNVISVKLVAYNTEGELVLGQDQGSIGSSTFVMPYKNNEIITNVEEISEAGSEASVIYSIDGRKIMSNDVKSLNKGLYIVNGKKVLVK